MTLSVIVESLLNNDKELCLRATNSLIKIANNILKNPNEDKFRRLNLSSEVVEKTILPAVGAVEILFLMGFEEGDDKLIMPLTSSLENVKKYRNELEVLRSKHYPHQLIASSQQGNTSKNTTMKKSVSSSCTINEAYISDVINQEYKMKKELNDRFQSVLQFESPSLQEAARNIIPIQDLNRNARKKVSILNENRPTSPEYKPMDFQDCLLIELMSWFKEEYFSWFDQGTCDLCQRSMKFIQYITPTPMEISAGAARVEQHKCGLCGKEERFPRLFNPGELMKTKKGRCMEWASCFTFFCRTLGFDARYVVDDTDHVWTEIFSQSQNRWLHADSCENKLDTPLMYEKGWGKKLSYIFAFSKDEIVDCVWRYSTNHKDVCSRRKRCREEWLISIIFSFNEERQKLYSPDKKRFIEHRLVSEIVEFMNPITMEKEGENEGRSSGSLAWRLERGEVSEANEAFVFSPSKEEIAGKEIIVKYSSSQDLYIRPFNNNLETKGWQKYTFHSKNIFRKHEKDWKICYIARKEGSTEGSVSWKFDWSKYPLKLKSIHITFQHKTYENGAVHWQLCSDDMCFAGNKNGILELSTSEFKDNIKQFSLVVNLVGGEGDVAWQHSQLFRQEENSGEFPYIVHLKFEE